MSYDPIYTSVRIGEILFTLHTLLPTKKKVFHQINNTFHMRIEKINYNHQRESSKIQYMDLIS